MDYEAALTYAITSFSEATPPSVSALLDDAISVASRLDQTGHLSLSEPLLRALLAVYRGLGVPDAALVELYGNLAHTLAVYDHSHAPEKLFEYVIAALEAEDPLPIAALARYIGFLGSFYNGKRRYAEAAAQHRKALSLRERHLGPDALDTHLSRNNLGLSLIGQEKYEDAYPHIATALSARRRLLGDAHPDTIATLTNMSHVEHARGNVQVAGSLLHSCISTLREHNLTHFPEYHRCLTSYALLRFAAGEIDEALSLVREALDVLRSASAGNDAQVLGLRVIVYLLDLLKQHGDVPEVADKVIEQLHQLGWRRDTPDVGT